METFKQYKWSTLIIISVIAGIISGFIVLGGNELRQIVVNAPSSETIGTAKSDGLTGLKKPAESSRLSKLKKLFLSAAVESTISQTPLAITSVVQTPLTYKYGLSLSETMYGLSDAQLNDRLNDIASLGIGWIRFDMSWNIIQPNDAATFRWNETDRIISAINAHNIKVMPILLQTPYWARLPECQGDQKCMPANPTIFAAFAQKAVERYASQGVHTWEIWNEPNIPGFWKPAPSPKDYTDLLKAAYTAIKTADSSATVVTGGLSPAATTGSDISPRDFLAGLYEDGAGGYFDAVGMHPYSYPVSPSTYKVWNAWSQMSLTPTNLRGIMTANGDSGKAIWMTEFGIPTGGPGALVTSGVYQEGGSPYHVDEPLQAVMMEDAIRTAQNYSWAGPLFIYSYKDIGTSQDTNENFFGIIRYDGAPKPSYDTIKSLLVPSPPPASSSSSAVSSSSSSEASSEASSSSAQSVSSSSLSASSSSATDSSSSISNEYSEPAQNNNSGGGGGGGGSFSPQVMMAESSSIKNDNQNLSSEASAESGTTKREKNGDAPVGIGSGGAAVSNSNETSAQTVSGGVSIIEEPTAKVISGKFNVGMADERVKILQSVLARDPEIYPEGRITGYYGTTTVLAIQRFQKKYGLIGYGTPKTTGFGLAGPKTREKLNEVFGASSTQNLEPQSGASGVSDISKMTPDKKESLIKAIQSQIDELIKRVLELTTPQSISR